MALTHKQHVFVQEYLKGFNATAAAVAAGYSEKTARAIGHENLTKPDIAAEIERRMTELTMSTEEALVRLTEQARGAHTAFIGVGGRVDLAGLKTAGLAHLIKSTKETKYGLVVEFHDGQAAIDKILRVRGAYVERHEVSGKGGAAIQHEHKGQVHGSVEHVAAVVAGLVELGAIALPGTSAGGDAEDDGLHS